MRKASAPTLFLVGLLVLAAVAAITFGVSHVVGLDDDADDDAGVVAGIPTPTSVAGLAPTQVTVTGVATAIVVSGAVLADDVVAPAVTTPSAGLGAGARFEGVLVDDADAAISWDAGRPLAFAAETPLRLGHDLPFDLFAASTGITIGFVDGRAYAVVPGSYEIDAPVAVTTTGLGQSRESVAFTAGEATTVAFTGGANVTLPAGPLVVEGPGAVGMQGTFELRRADGSVQQATAIDLSQGSFRLSIAPTLDGSGYALGEALLEGPVTAV